MNKLISFISFLVFILIFSLSSCVSGKKLEASEASVEKLKNENTQTQNQLNICNAEIQSINKKKTAVENEYSSVQKELMSLSSESKITISEQARRLRELQERIQAQKNIMFKLKNTLSDALMNYKTDELNLSIKNGNVYVALEEKLLFKSGSDLVDPKGKEALKSLAMIINNTVDINVMVEGHTDSISIKNKTFKDNWDLSTARATSILRILSVDFGFNPNRITASGKGMYHPVKANDTEEGRASNRRTEIILSPDLDEIYKLLYD